MTRPLGERAQETLDAVRDLQPMTREKLMDWLGLKADAASRRLQLLHKRGLIVRSGFGRFATWSIAPAKAEETAK